MKILLVSGHYYPHVFGGTEKVVQSLAEELARRGHSVTVVALTPNTSAECNVISGVKVYYVPTANIYFPGRPQAKSVGRKLLWHIFDNYNPVMALRFARILTRVQPDVVNTHNIGGFSAAIWSVTHSRHIPLVHTSHGLNLLCPWYMSRGGRACASLCGTCRAYAWTKVRFSRNVDVFTAVSRYIVDTYARYGVFPNADKMVIYNSCTAQSTAMSDRSKSHILRFGFMGRLHPSKGMHNLLRSYLQMAPGTAELLIAGSGAEEYENQLRQIANGHPGVRWLGVVKPEAFLPGIDVLVVPSVVHDSAPLVISESMSCGVPVIGARRGGIPELMGEGTGYVFDPGEPEALTRTMEAVLRVRDELPAMGRRAISRARDFSPERMISGYMNAYDTAISRAGANG